MKNFRGVSKPPTRSVASAQVVPSGTAINLRSTWPASTYLVINEKLAWNIEEVLSVCNKS